MRVTRHLAGRIFPVLACCAGLVGCAEPLAPTAVRGLYVREGPPSAIVLAEETIRVLADTIVLGEDFRGVRRVVVERLAAGAPMPLLERTEYAFNYRLEDGAVGVQYEPDCATMLCAALASREWYNLWPSGQAMAPRADRTALYTRRGT